MHPSTSRLVVDSVAKTFGHTRALAGVSLTLQSGSIHALVGQNGSGKSTLVKVLSGLCAPDAGGATINGTRVRYGMSAKEFARLGVGFLQQDVGLALGLSVVENLRVGRLSHTWAGRLPWAAERRRARAVLEAIDLDVSPDARVRELTASQRALLGFGRAVDAAGPDPQLLVLDEPTVYLPRPAVARLFAGVRRVAEQGCAVLFISHRLDEVLQFTDHVTVLRDGVVTGDFETSQSDSGLLIEAMVGRRLDVRSAQPSVSGTARTTDEALSVASLSYGPLADVSFRIGRGEIVGVTGLLGSGYEDVPYAVYGAVRARGMRVRVRGAAVQHPTPRAMRKAGVAFVPADRAASAGVAAATVAENVALPNLRGLRSHGILKYSRQRSFARDLCEQYHVRPRDPDLPLGALSGGNQQKALLAKWIHMPLQALLLHEPVQGVDVESRLEIYAFLRQTADRGTGILVASGEQEDLARLCDRVLVLADGRQTAELSGSRLTPDNVVDACLRGTNS